MRVVWRLPMTAVAIVIAPIVGSTFVSYGSFWSRLEPRLGGADSNYNKVKVSKGVAGRGRPKGAAGLKAAWIDEQVLRQERIFNDTPWSKSTGYRKR